jgi:ribosomal protein S18 acetylase RimI-like enzyme
MVKGPTDYKVEMLERTRWLTRMITFKQCVLEDLTTLQNISRKTFEDTFAATNTEVNMNAYIERAFNREKLEGEMLNPSSSFHLVYMDGELAGYLKLNVDRAQTDIHDPRSLEVERIYIVKEFQGLGLGSRLMSKAVEVAVEHSKSFIWLGVWERNEAALRFYRKMGFYRIGEHLFVVGDDPQTDLILRKDL